MGVLRGVTNWYSLISAVICDLCCDIPWSLLWYLCSRILPITCGFLIHILKWLSEWMGWYRFSSLSMTWSFVLMIIFCFQNSPLCFIYLFFKMKSNRGLTREGNEDKKLNKVLVELHHCFSILEYLQQTFKNVKKLLLWKGQFNICIQL